MNEQTRLHREEGQTIVIQSDRGAIDVVLFVFLIVSAAFAVTPIWIWMRGTSVQPPWLFLVITASGLGLASLMFVFLLRVTVTLDRQHRQMTSSYSLGFTLYRKRLILHPFIAIEVSEINDSELFAADLIQADGTKKTLALTSHHYGELMNSACHISKFIGLPLKEITGRFPRTFGHAESFLFVERLRRGGESFEDLKCPSNGRMSFSEMARGFEASFVSHHLASIPGARRSPPATRIIAARDGFTVFQNKEETHIPFSDIYDIQSHVMPDDDKEFLSVLSGTLGKKNLKPVSTSIVQLLRTKYVSRGVTLKSKQGLFYLGWGHPKEDILFLESRMKTAVRDALP